ELAAAGDPTNQALQDAAVAARDAADEATQAAADALAEAANKEVTDEVVSAVNELLGLDETAGIPE
ncbi:MAG: hypothetical protein RPU35_04450, partial [Candidatus Sedimenticola sp. (ex Thyasira tokunagai)]